MRVISLGWGVQSFTLAAMSALGELPKVDAAIHADTGHEASGTYAFAEAWTPWLQERGVNVVTVHHVRAEMITDRPGKEIFIPAFTSPTDGSGGRGGMLHRQCTGRWKIAPIRRWLQANRDGECVEQWIGITTDEAMRMKDSDVQYITNRWPLVEMAMSRLGCVRWLKEHELPIPPKSACIFCPLHDTKMWHDMKNNEDGDWAKAVEVDRRIRFLRPRTEVYLHPSRTPLESVDFETAEEKGQLNLWNNECEGVCGV